MVQNNSWSWARISSLTGLLQYLSRIMSDALEEHDGKVSIDTICLCRMVLPEGMSLGNSPTRDIDNTLYKNMPEDERYTFKRNNSTIFFYVSFLNKGGAQANKGGSVG